MTPIKPAPLALGGTMGVVMLVMLHRPLMYGSLTALDGLIGFALAHIAVVAGVMGLALLIPPFRTRIKRHRPSASHVLGMVTGMLITMTVIHLFAHGTFV